MSVQTVNMLTDEHSWPMWFHHIKNVTIKQQIWDYMDPSVDNPPNLPAKPWEPVFSDYKLEATLYSALSTKHQCLFNHEFQYWDCRAAMVEAIVDKRNDIDDCIYSIMAIQHWLILINKDTPHAKLKALKECFTQDPYTHIWDLYQRWYHYLIKTPCAQNIQKWLFDWDDFLVAVCGIDEPCLKEKNEDHNTIFYFIDAI